MNDIHSGHSERKTAEKFGESRQWIQQLKRQEKQTGSFEAKPLKGVAESAVNVIGYPFERQKIKSNAAPVRKNSIW